MYYKGLLVILEELYLVDISTNTLKNGMSIPEFII